MRALVVGAGPAGLSAALNACREGHEVSVFEARDRTGVKICGEALAREALSYVGVAPSKRFIVNEVRGFRLSFRGKYIREADFKDLPYAPSYVIDKPALLDAIREKAEESGAKIFFDARVSEADPKTGKIRLDDGKVERGDLIICADGVGSVARSHLDYSRYGTALCVQCRCSMPRELDPQYLYLDIVGEGYAWAFPKKDCVNIGVGLPKNSLLAQSIKKILTEYVERLGAKPMGKASFAPISVGGPIKSFGIGKLVVAGEAAGCVMPLSGEGNRFGLFAGSIAYKPGYQYKFMRRYGRRMLRSRRMLELVEKLDDDERVDFLELVDNPMEMFEGNLPRKSEFLLKPKLLMRIMQTIKI